MSDVHWHACTRPESPPGKGVRYHARGCRGCYLALMAAAAQHYPAGHRLTRRRTGKQVFVTDVLADMGRTLHA